MGILWSKEEQGSVNLLYDDIKYPSVFFHEQVTYVEQPLTDPTRALGTYGVKDGDVVVLRQADRRPPPTQPGFPGNMLHG